jgi:glycosyltransferase involved in cell wall biosynthesis
MIGLELKTYSSKAAGVGRYTVELVDNLLRRKQFSYFGFTSPQTESLRVPLASKQYFVNTKSTVLRSISIPMFHWKADIKLLHTLDASTFYGLSARGVKRLTTIHDLIPLKYPQYFTRKMRMVLKGRFYHAVNSSDFLISDSNSTKLDLLNYFPKLKEEKIIVIPLASSISKNDCHDSIESPTLQKMLSQNKQYFLSVATHEPRKNIKLVIEAFQALRQSDHSEIKLVLVGQRGWLESAAIHTKPELLENVTCTGAISDQELKGWYKKAVALVYPSLYEGFGLPVLEGMAMGCPVITSNISSLPEVAGNAAKLVDPYSLAELKEAMKYFLESQDKRKSYIAKGLNQSAKFSWNKTAELTEHVYSNLL